MTKTYQMTQWDLGRTLPLNFPQVHFALTNSDECLVVESKNNCVSVPNILLQDGRDIYVWIVENGVSIHQAKIVVKHKPKPVDYIYTETEILSFQKLEQKVKDALANLDTSIQEVEELKSKVDAAQATATAAINDTKAKAESAINEAKTSAESTINDAKYKADAALLKAQEAQSKADAAVDQANTSVSKAAQSVANSESAIGESKAAIQEVKNLSNKLFPAAENTLVGESKDKVVHVDDAFDGASLRKITVEGAAKQVTTIGKNIVKLDEAKEILRGLELDVKSSGQVVINGTTKSELWEKIGTVDVVAGKTYVLSLNKAYPTIGVSAWSDSDSKHVLFAYVGQQTDTTAVTKTETLSIYLSGGNGSTFNNEVVSIQIEEGTSKTDWEPYTGGKPSPNPDYPQPITVIENPTVKVVGRNLANPSEAYYFAAQGTPKAEQIADGFRFTVTGNDTRLLAIPFGVKKGDVIVVNFDWKKISGNATRIALYFPKLNAYLQIGKPHVMEGDADFIAIYVDADTVGEFEVTNFRVSFSADGGYAPYTSQQLAFTLPQEHPYLAKLPDGTADEIVVDEAGNVELVARVSKETIVASKIVDTWGKGYAIYSWPKDGRYSPNAPSDGTAVICDKLKAETGSNIYRGLGIGISVGSTIANNKSCTTTIALGDGADLSSIDGASFYYPLMTETRYPLGKIEMPKAQDSIVNAWTDAEVTPNTSIKYTRDINIAFDKLANAIVASVGGES